MHAAESSPLGLQTPVFCDGKASEDVQAIARVEIDDEGDCMITLI